ncbi:hypothetical protein F4780DRAFT_796077 [Xylariomycetidae sp. FL0641]|nr:hypothetical protein F4780DRAFT_796077 [Xylariomycetidae sp. FL0641]
MKGQCSPLGLLTVVLGSLGGLGGLGWARTVSRRGADDPSASDFIRRSCEAVAVIGDYVYIDGGTISERVNGSEPGSIQDTLSISLKESWTNETVAMQTIPKEAPHLGRQIYWTDTSTNSMYTWGGIATNGTPPSSELWRFEANETGGGAWTQVTQRDYRDFIRLLSPTGSAFTQGNGVGYALGGQVSAETDARVTKAAPGYALPGLVSYDFTTGEWGNASSAAYGRYGTVVNGRAEWVPYGPNGLLVFLGGAESPVDATNKSFVQQTWYAVTLVDPVSGQWYEQKTTSSWGSWPPTTESGCSVGVQGPNGTYEIYYYGGVSDQFGGTTGDVVVLSLPGFVFFKSAAPGPPHSDHACAVVGPGRRQMLSVGGADGASPRNATAPTTADPWARGLGVYDMTAMAWADRYDPAAPPYESPDEVQAWYAAGGLAAVDWDSDAVRALFANASNTLISNSSGTSSSSSGSSGTRTARIVGGAVGGGVGAALTASLLVLLRRRSRERRAAEARIRAATAEPPDDGIAEYRPEPWPKDAAAADDLYPRYLSPVSGVTTADGTVVEMGGGSGTWPGELPADEVGDAGDDGGGGARRGGGGGAPLRELPGLDVDWTYELPAPLHSPAAELPARKYST